MANNKFEWFPRPTTAQAQNLIAYNVQMRKYAQIAIDNFEYDGLEEIGLEARRIEVPLFNTGYGCLFYDKTIGFVFLPATLQGDLNVYGEPTKWAGVGIGDTFQVNETNSVLFRNDLFGNAGVSLAQYYAQKVSDVQRTIDTHVALLKMPYLIKGTDKDILSKKNILDKKNDNEIAIFVNNKVSGDDFEVLTTPTPYVIDRLYSYKQELEGEYFAMLGYNSNPQEKRERLLVDEINANNEFTENGYAGAMFQMRENACNKANEMFGTRLVPHIKRVRIKTPQFYTIGEDYDSSYESDNDTTERKEGAD